MSQECFFEGCGAPAPWGLRFPGPMAEVPKKYQGYLWHCEDHEAAAEDRLNTALVGQGLRKAS